MTEAKTGATIEGEQVRLTPLAPADAEAMFRWINDRELVVKNGPFRPVSTQQHEAWFAAVQRRDDTAIFAIRTTAADRLVGSCQLHSINREHLDAELQIRLGEADARGLGHGSEAVRLLVDFGFSELDLHRIHLHVLADNEVALRAYERVGFRREGVNREAALIEGNRVDLISMGLLRSEFRG